MAKAVVSRKEFANMIGVSPRAISHYVANRQLTGRAVVREGSRIFIRVAIAKQQLRQTLAAQTRGRQLTGGAQLDDDDSRRSRHRSVEIQIKSEILRRLQIANRRAEGEIAAFAGRYVDAAAVEDTLRHLPTMTLDIFEAQLPTLIAAIADTFHVPRDEVAAIAADQMKSIRRRATAKRRTRNGNGKAH